MKKIILLLLALIWFTTLHAQQWETPESYINHQTNQTVCNMVYLHGKAYVAYSVSGNVNVAMWDSATKIIKNITYNLTTAGGYPVGYQISPGLSAMTVFNDTVYFAYNSTAYSTYSPTIVKFTGSGWAGATRSLSNGWVKQFIEYKKHLYIIGSGSFTGMVRIDTVLVANPYYCNIVPSILKGTFGIYCATVFNSKLYLGGYFYSKATAGDTTFYIVSYDGTTISKVCANIYKYHNNSDAGFRLSTAGYPTAMAVYNDTLYIGGSNNFMHFSNDTSYKNAGSILKLSMDGNWWGGQGSIGNVIDTTTTNIVPTNFSIYDNKIFMTMTGTKINNNSYRNIVSYDGAAFSDLEGGVNGNIFTTMIGNNKLLVGGQFDSTGAISVNRNIGMWDDFNITMGILPVIESALSVYPNPSKTEFYVSGLQGKTEYIIYDTSGRVLGTGTFIESIGWIKIGNTPSGIYLLKLTDRFGTRTERLEIF